MACVAFISFSPSVFTIIGASFLLTRLRVALTTTSSKPNKSSTNSMINLFLLDSLMKIVASFGL